MSDSKRATLITVGATKSSNNNVNKTVRLTINLDESNESKYPELNYKELVTAEEKIKKLENGKTKGLDPFSDIDDDVEQVARKFEQKYGGKSTYGKKGRTKADDFADIGAGYDENDSFIDNTDGYDEMIPPGCDTLYGGFYINCGDLMFKSVPGNQIALSDCEPGSRKNKHFASSSSDESSESSSESSHDEKDTKPAVNGDVDSHNTEHRKKKNKKMDKIQPKKKHRTDSSAATSGKQTSDDNIPNEGESADSRTSHSDSLTSKPAPSSENVATSDSSRDVETKVEVKLPPHVAQIVDELMSLISKHKTENAGLSAQQLLAKMEPNLFRLDRVLQKPHASTTARRIAWTKIAKCMKMSRSALLQRVKHLCGDTQPPPPATSAQQISPTNATAAINTTATTRTTTATTNNKRKTMDSDAATNNISDEQREKCIVDTLKRLKTLIDEKTPGMMATYNAECERVQEERKKIQIASSSGSAPHVEKRLPKRRFPWCPASRKLLIALTQIAGDESKAVELLTRRALPLFPSGFVRLPTLLRQADLSKEAKGAETKRPRLGSATQSSKAITATTPITTTAQSQTFTEPITFPAALTVTTSNKISPDKTETLNNTEEKDKKSNSVFGSLLNSFSISKDLVVETESRLKEDKGKEDLYIPPNSIGSITITPVPSQNQKTDKKVNDSGERLKEPLLKIKSPAALNEMVNKEVKKDKEKLKKDKNNVKEKRVNSPLHIDTSYQTNKKTPSPKDEIAQNLEISKKRIESMRNAENNIPRPALVPVHHSPTFAKPDKRPPEVKKKKEIVIMSDVDPLAEVPNEPVSIDDSDSDVELIEDSRNVDSVNSDVPSMDKVTNTKKDSAKVSSDRNEQLDAPTKEDIDIVMRNLREMEHSQEPTKLNSFGGVITNAQKELL